MKIAVVGCGGIGGVIAWTLARRGADVTVLESNPEGARDIGKGGITVEDKCRTCTAKVRAIPAWDETRDRFDLTVLAVKSRNLRDAFDAAVPRLSESGFVLTVQNGLEVLSIAGDRPNVRIAAGAVGFNAQMIEYGRCKLTSKGGIVVGALDGGTAQQGEEWPSPALARLKAVFGPPIPVSVVEEIRGVLWAKLVITSAVTGLGGVTDLKLGKLLGRRVARRLFYLLAGEGVAVASQAGVKIGKMPGAVNPVKFTAGPGGVPVCLRYALLKFAGWKYRDLVSNISVDLKRGVKTEVDYINGAVVALGAKRGVPTSVNAEIVRMVKEMEAGARRMGPHNLGEMWDTVRGDALDEG